MFQIDSNKAQQFESVASCAVTVGTVGTGCWDKRVLEPSDGGRGRIFRAGLELPAGASPDDRGDVELLMDNLPEPIDLDIDHGAQVLYCEGAKRSLWMLDVASSWSSPNNFLSPAYSRE